MQEQLKGSLETALAHPGVDDGLLTISTSIWLHKCNLEALQPHSHWLSPLLVVLFVLFSQSWVGL